MSQTRLGPATPAPTDLSETIPLADLSDVTITSPADNELLTYDSTSGEWINQTPTEAGLDDIYVNITGDTMTGTLQINVPTTTSEALILQTTDDNTTKNLLEVHSSAGATLLSIPATGNTITTPTTSLSLEQTGDSYGTTRLELLNRDGTAGAKFTNDDLDLVDFQFEGSSGDQLSIRSEFRNASVNQSGNTEEIVMGIIPFATTANRWFGIGASGGFFQYEHGFGTTYRTTSPGAQLAVQPNASGTIGAIIKGAASQSANLTEWQKSDGTVHASIGPDSLATDGTQNWLNVTGTFPTSVTGLMTGVLMDITTAGSSNENIRGLVVNLNAGYTGNRFTMAMGFDNNVAGTGASYTEDNIFGYYLSRGNRGVGGYARAETTGHNVGGMFLANQGDVNYGVWGTSTITKNSATNIGVFGSGLNAGTSPIQIGGYFTMYDADAAPPCDTSAALIADNGAQTDPIALFRDNGTTVFQINDTGTTTSQLTIPVATDIGLTIKGAASQSANLLELQDSSANVLVSSGIDANYTTGFLHISGDSPSAQFSQISAPFKLEHQVDRNPGAGTYTRGAYAWLEQTATNTNSVGAMTGKIVYQGTNTFSQGTAYATAGVGKFQNANATITSFIHLWAVDDASSTSTVTTQTGLRISQLTAGTTINAIHADMGHCIFNDDGGDYDFRIEGDTEDNLFYVDAGTDTVRMGDWDTNYVEVDKAGDMVFVGGGGLAFAEIYVEGNSTADTVSTATWTQITRFDTNGVSNNMTPDHTNDHITVVEPGMYLCTISIAFSGDASVDWKFSLYKNNGNTQFTNVHTNRKLGAGGDIGSASMSGIVDLAASDTIELWMQHAEGVNKDITVQDCTMSLVQIGGT